MGLGKEICIKSYADFIHQAVIKDYKESDSEIHVWGNTATAFYSYEIAWEMNRKSLKKQDVIFLFLYLKIVNGWRFGGWSECRIKWHFFLKNKAPTDINNPMNFKTKVINTTYYPEFEQFKTAMQDFFENIDLKKGGLKHFIVINFHIVEIELNLKTIST